jgi:hypothetical protein
MQYVLRIAILLLCLAVPVLPHYGCAAVADGHTPAITVPEGASTMETLAAREVQRYVYLRTGSLLSISGKPLEASETITVGRKDRPIVRQTAAAAGIASEVEALGPQEYLVRTLEADGRQCVVITGGDDIGTLYGAYRFAEHLGVRFYLHGDVVPDGKMPLQWPDIDDHGRPLFELRGIQPFHDFPEGPDWWNVDDYKAVIAQLPKLRMNFIGLHTYPEGGPNAEPTVWIGLPEDVGENGGVQFSYPSSYYNTRRWTWGYFPKNTSDYLFGASMLFDRDDYGPDLMRDATPQPETVEMSNAVFERTAIMLRQAFEYARALGVKTCVGTETPLTVPAALRQRLEKKGKNPGDPKVIGELYEGILSRITASYPIDYYWLWTPEWWLGNVPEDHVKKTVDDMLSAVEAAKQIKAPFRMATCGWVLGPQNDRAMWDKVLPRDMPVSCINRDVGKAPVDPAFLFAQERERWAIPWLEDDPALTSPQLWVGRMRKDAVDALEYGCTGLMGIHWRTRVLAPNVLALSRAAWDQSGWEHNGHVSGAVGGAVAGPSPRPIEGTEDDTLYQTVRWAVPMYRLFVPNGTYSVTLKFSEFTFGRKGVRAFDVTIQGSKVIEDLDIFAEAGFDKALDYTFENIKVENKCLEIGFIARRDAPAIAAIEVKGPSGSLKMNCGGPEYKDFSKDVQLFTINAPSDDFYLDWASSQFGKEIGKRAAEIFTRMDCNLPQPCGWVGGPGGIGGDPRPWPEIEKDYSFVDELAALRPDVRGTGNLDRFDYWLNTFLYMKAIARVECMLSQFDQALASANTVEDPAEKKRLARKSALPKRVELIEALAELYKYMLATVSTPGEMGTIANWEQHILPGLLGDRGEKLEALLGERLPAAATPSTEYKGPDRIIVPTLRASIAEGEILQLKIMVLSAGSVKSAAAHWRELGRGEYSEVPLRHVARGVYTAAFPPEGVKTASLEYYVTATSAGGAEITFPATAPSANQTVVVVPLRQSRHGE